MAEIVSAWEDRALLKAGFEPTDGDGLWRRDGVWYGKEAALQEAWQMNLLEAGEAAAEGARRPA